MSQTQALPPIATEQPDYLDELIIAQRRAVRMRAPVQLDRLSLLALGAYHATGRRAYRVLGNGAAKLAADLRAHNNRRMH